MLRVRHTIARYGRQIFVLCVAVWVLYFVWLATARMTQLWTSYFDLGIMHQTVYNSYMALTTGDMTRWLELTDPHGSGMQIKRMAIHYDPMLGFLSLAYYIYPGPETLLVIQVLVVASGAIALSLLARSRHLHSHSWVTVYLLPILYLMYPALQRSITYDFHAVTLATGIILWMYYAWVKRRYVWCGILGFAALCTKEHVGVTLGVWLGMEALSRIWRSITVGTVHRIHARTLVRHILRYHLSARDTLLIVGAVMCVLWSAWTIFVSMPGHRSGDDHFALKYYDSSSGGSRAGVGDVLVYALTLLGPLALTPLGSMITIPAIVDFAVNTLSSSGSMRNIYYHYTAIITPWLFLGALSTISQLIHRRPQWSRAIALILIAMTALYSWLESPLPYSRASDGQIYTAPPAALRDIQLWQQILVRDDIAVSSTGQYAPYLTSRRYFYDFGEEYSRAEFVVLRLTEIYDYPDRDRLIPIYDRLKTDKNYIKIYENQGTEVYKRELSKKQ